MLKYNVIYNNHAVMEGAEVESLYNFVERLPTTLTAESPS